MTYEELCSFEVLYKAYLEARKGKRSKSKTIEYEAQALACTEKLSRKLAVRDVRQPGGDIRQQICYVPSKFEVFAVYEPKRRMVHCQNQSQRRVQRFYCCAAGQPEHQHL